MQTARIGGVDIAFSTQGDTGSPVLLIMGYTMRGDVWIHQWPTLAGHHQVTYFDNRGVGRSSPTTGPLAMADFARDTVGLLDHLGWSTAHVVGVSMGGMIAQHVALAAPDRIRSLTLIATHAGGVRAALPTVRGLKRFVQANIADRATRVAALSRLLYPDEFRKTCDQEWLMDVLAHDFADPAPATTRRHQLAAILRHDTRDELHKLPRVPTLIMRPGLDILVKPTQSDVIADRATHATVMRFDDAGHGLIRQCKDAVNAALLAHFKAADDAIEPRS